MDDSATIAQDELKNTYQRRKDLQVAARGQVARATFASPTWWPQSLKGMTPESTTESLRDI